MAAVHDAVEAYLARGWRPIRVQALGKKPVSNAWQNTTPAAYHFQATDNVGIALGSKSAGLVDIDLDVPTARALAQEPGLFGHLPAFGREGQIPGHRLVICHDAPDQDDAFRLAG